MQKWHSPLRWETESTSAAISGDARLVAMLEDHDKEDWKVVILCTHYIHVHDGRGAIQGAFGISPQLFQINTHRLESLRFVI